MCVSPLRAGSVLCCAFALMAAGGCRQVTGGETYRPADLVDDCVVPAPDGVAGLNEPAALEYADGSLWIWSTLTTTAATGGMTLTTPGAFVAGGVDGCARPALARTGDGAPVTFLPLVADEIAENAARLAAGDGRQITLSPLGGFVSNGQGVLYFEKALTGPGLFDPAQPLGIGACLLPDRAAPCQRADSSLLWSGVGYSWGTTGFVDQDGWAYVYGCFSPAANQDLCSVGRVQPADVLNASAYQFRSWPETWNSGDEWSTVPVLDDRGTLSVSFNPFLGRYLAVTSDIWSSSIELYNSTQVTDALTGPFQLAGAVPAATFFISGAAEHSGLRSADGQTIAVTYWTNGAAAPGLHLMRFHLVKPLGS